MATNDIKQTAQNQTGNTRPKETDIIRQALETGELPEIDRDDSASVDESLATAPAKSEDSNSEVS